MTAEEIKQVQDYIAKMEVAHVIETNKIHRQVAMARGEVGKMVQGMNEIYRMSKSTDNSSPQELRAAMREVIEHFCPDYDIPF